MRKMQTPSDLFLGSDRICRKSRSSVAQCRTLPRTSLSSLFLEQLMRFGSLSWGQPSNRPALADVLAPNVRLAPAIAFYLTFPIGIVVFSVLPSLRAGSLTSAFALGALFGAIAYATYDLSNYATLRVWTLQITVLDICYGALEKPFISRLARF
jgi:uncharacterized membrane protein